MVQFTGIAGFKRIPQRWNQQRLATQFSTKRRADSVTASCYFWDHLFINNNTIPYHTNQHACIYYIGSLLTLAFIYQP